MKTENVDFTPVYSWHRLFLINYYPNLDIVAQFNLTSENEAMCIKDSLSVGMWRVKQYKNVL